jgi:hypothetical protein
MKLHWFGRKKGASPPPIVGAPPPWASKERRVFIPWWIWHDESRCYRHTTSGEEIRYVGPTACPAGTRSDWLWHRFDYVHTDLTYPILVEVRDFRGRITEKVPLRAMSGQDNPVVWRIDHDVCRVVWQREQKLGSDIPPYGVWLRYEEAFVGAALAWGNIGPLNGRPDEVVASAGWSNGAWRTELYRRFGYCWSGGDYSSPFDPEHPTQLKPWLKLGFPSPTDYEPVKLDRQPIVWHEQLSVVDDEVEYGKIVPTPMYTMQAANARIIRLWTQIFVSRNREGPEYVYVHNLAITLPGVTADLFFDTHLFHPNPDWAGIPFRPAPRCKIALELGSTAVRVDSQPLFERAFGTIHPAEFLGPRNYVGFASTGHWIAAQVDKPTLTRELICALQDAIAASTGFTSANAASQGRTFGELSEISLTAYPISGLKSGALMLRRSLQIQFDALDDQAAAAQAAQPWLKFFS